MKSASVVRSTFRCCCGVAALLLVSGCAIRWQLDFNEAAKEAQSQKKPMLLYFKDWSSAEHRNLVIEVWGSPIVARELQDTVNVELLYNWGPEAARYKIHDRQVCVFCRPDGSEVAREVLRPLPKPEKFAAWIKQCKQMMATPVALPAPAKSR